MTDEVRIAAIGDIHAPLYLDLFTKALERASKEEFDILLVAGDLIERGDVSQLDEVCPALRSVDRPVIGCFGNNEYEDLEDRIRKACPAVLFLSEGVHQLEVRGTKIGILGSRGCLDQPTRWQLRNVPNVIEKYRRRAERIRELSTKMSSFDLRILLIHYPPTYKVLIGENPRYHSQMGCKKLEDIIPNFDLVVTAHAHKGAKLAMIGGTPVYNVALPLNKELVLIRARKRRQARLDLFL